MLFVKKPKTKPPTLTQLQAQGPRRRHDRFRRGIFDLTKLLIAQNKLIIDLLVEIRDRLPPPENSTS
ncbi:MAG: hypothetical protein PHC61_16360 [Chitinivibrionales bacterium]|nr:hypothetical protein [Chitinivibrionales bacterium]